MLYTFLPEQCSIAEWVPAYIMTECYDFATLIVLLYDQEKERQFQIYNSTVKFSWAWRLSSIPKVISLCCNVNFFSFFTALKLKGFSAFSLFVFSVKTQNERNYCSISFQNFGFNLMYFHVCNHKFETDIDLRVVWKYNPRLFKAQGLIFFHFWNLRFFLFTTWRGNYRRCWRNHYILKYLQCIHRGVVSVGSVGSTDIWKVWNGTHRFWGSVDVNHSLLKQHN